MFHGAEPINREARDTLCNLITRPGTAFSGQPRRVEAFLRDLCGEYKPEIFVLVSALEERMIAELPVFREAVALEVLLTRVTKRLEDNRALTTEAARWAEEILSASHTIR